MTVYRFYAEFPRNLGQFNRPDSPRRPFTAPMFERNSLETDHRVQYEITVLQV